MYIECCLLEVVKACLEDGSGEYYDDINPFDQIKRIRNYVRIDFDDIGFKEYSHSLIHFHFGAEKNNELRIPVEHVVLPFEFLYFVLKYIYEVDDDELRVLDCQYERDTKLTENERLRVRIAFSNNTNA